MLAVRQVFVKYNLKERVRSLGNVLLKNIGVKFLIFIINLRKI